MKNAAQTILDRIEAGVQAYHNDLVAMTDLQLWDHCFGPDCEPSLPEDFCIQEWQKRDTYCLCPVEMRTGWIEIDDKCACNICGKEQEGEVLSKFEK